MSIGSWATKIIKKLSWVEIVLVKLSCIAFGIMLVMLIPQLLTINVWWIITAFLILALKPIIKAIRK